VVNFIDITDKFYPGINNAVLMFEERGKAPAGNITIFIYCGSQNGTMIFPVPDRVVRTATEERDTEGGTTDNQLNTS
jgi:hypothetical protein